METTPDILHEKSVLEYLDLYGIVATPRGLSFTKPLSLDEYGQVLDVLVAANENTNSVLRFWMGDWYNSLMLGYREKAEQILDRFGEGWYQNLRKWGHVASVFPPERRHPKVFWSLYKEVLPLSAKMQDFYLQQAIESRQGAIIARVRADLRAQKSLELQEKKSKKSEPQWSEGKKFGAVADREMPTTAVAVRAAGVSGEREPLSLATLDEDPDPFADIDGGSLSDIEETRTDAIRHGEYVLKLDHDHYAKALDIAEAMQKRTRKLYTVEDVVYDMIDNNHRVMGLG